MITLWEALLAIYIALNFVGAIIFLVICGGGCNWEDLFNPYEIYQEVKVNWFGAWLLATIAFLCMTPFALIFYIYKLCTVGRR